MPNNVLIIACMEDSRRAAHDVIAVLRSFGYASETCRAPGEDSDVKPDRLLDGDTSLSDYEGVVFMDDGGDSEAAVKLARKAIKVELALGGYAYGAVVLYDAGALKGHRVCAGLPDNLRDKSRDVDAPSVRDDRVITSAGDCAMGFAMLMVDAMGGKVKRIVEGESDEREPMQAKSILIVDDPGSWPDYWPLALDMRERGWSLALAGADDISGDGVSAAMLDVEAGDVRPCRGRPGVAWLRLGGAAEAETLLEMGCCCANPPSAIRLASNKEGLAAILDVVSPLYRKSYDESTLAAAAHDLVVGGPACVITHGRRPIRIIGHGKRALVCGRRSEVVDEQALARILRRATNGGVFTARRDAGDMRLGGEVVEFLHFMRNGTSGWESSLDLALTEGGDAFPARSFMAVAGLDPNRLKKARDMARRVSLAMQAHVDEPLLELVVTTTTDDEDAYALDVEATSDRNAPRSARLCEECLRKRAIGLGLDGDESTDLSDDEFGAHAMGMARDMERMRRDMDMLVAGRELAHENIWPQPDGRMAIKELDGIQMMDAAGAMDKLKEDALLAVRREIGKPSRKMAIMSLRARHRLRMLCEYLSALRDGSGMRTNASTGIMTKIAIYPSSVAGPWSHLDVPMFERVWEYHEGDDWLEDREKAISDLQRYNPEYDESGNGYGQFGYYYVWDERNRKPEDWNRVLSGDSPYKMRSLLTGPPTQGGYDK